MESPAGGQSPSSQDELTVFGPSRSEQQQQQAAQAAGESIAGPESPQPKQHRKTSARAAAPAATAAGGAQGAAVVEGMRGMRGVYPDVDPAMRRFTGGASGIPWGHGESGCVLQECLRPQGGGQPCSIVATACPTHQSQQMLQIRLWLHLMRLMPGPGTVQRLQRHWHAEHRAWPSQSLSIHVHAAACRWHPRGTLGLEVRHPDCEDPVCCLEQHTQQLHAA